jgi:hypothetical protein
MRNLFTCNHGQGLELPLLLLQGRGQILVERILPDLIEG